MQKKKQHRHLPGTSCGNISLSGTDKHSNRAMKFKKSPITFLNSTFVFSVCELFRLHVLIC